MNLHNLKKANEAKNKKRVGRGTGSGWGKTAGRGHKGQKARTGSSIPAWFEGGQTPLYQRLPKFGFTNAKFKKHYATVNVGRLNDFADNTTVTFKELKEAGIVKKELNGVKILGNGELNKKLNVKAAKFTKTAIDKIEKAGGTIEVI